MSLLAVVVNRNGASAFAGDQIPDVARHFHGRPMLEACLGALAPLAARPDCRVTVVDNGSTDGSVALVRERFPALRLIVNPDNRGFAPAVLQAAGEAPWDHLLLVNSDVLMADAQALSLVAEMASRPGVGALTCRTLYPGGSLQRPANRRPSAALAAAQLLGLSRLFPASAAFSPLDLGFDAEAYGEPAWIAGGVMLIRREAWDAVGGMDPGYRFYEEDADFCLRLGAAGWKAAYTPAVTVMHVRAATASREPVFTFIERYRGLVRLASRHFTLPGNLLVRALVLARMPLRALLGLLRGEAGIPAACVNVAAAALTKA